MITEQEIIELGWEKTKYKSPSYGNYYYVFNIPDDIPEGMIIMDNFHSGKFVLDYSEHSNKQNRIEEHYEGGFTGSGTKKIRYFGKMDNKEDLEVIMKLLEIDI